MPRTWPEWLRWLRNGAGPQGLRDLVSAVRINRMPIWDWALPDGTSPGGAGRKEVRRAAVAGYTATKLDRLRWLYESPPRARWPPEFGQLRSKEYAEDDSV